MDGVLADSEPLHQHAIRLLLAEYGIDWAPDGRDPTVGLTALEAFGLQGTSDRRRPRKSALKRGTRAPDSTRRKSRPKY